MKKQRRVVSKRRAVAQNRAGASKATAAVQGRAPMMDKRILVAAIAIAVLAVCGLLFLLLAGKAAPRNDIGTTVAPGQVSGQVPGQVNVQAGGAINQHPAPADSVLYIQADIRGLLKEPSVQNLQIPGGGGVRISDVIVAYQNQTGINVDDIDSVVMFADAKGQGGVLAKARSDFDIDTVLTKLDGIFGGKTETSTYGDATIRSASGGIQGYLFLDKRNLLLGSKTQGNDYIGSIIDVWRGDKRGLLENALNSEMLDKAGSGIVSGLFVLNDEMTAMIGDYLAYYATGLPAESIMGVIGDTEGFGFSIGSDKSIIVVMAKSPESAGNLKSIIDAGIVYMQAQWLSLEDQYGNETLVGDEQMAALGKIIKGLGEGRVYTDGNYLVIEINIGIGDAIMLAELFMTLSTYDGATYYSDLEEAESLLVDTQDAGGVEGAGQ